MKSNIQQRAAVLLAVLSVPFGTVQAGLPVSGVPVPEFADFDQEMLDYMTARNITAGVLAISIDGCIVYQRGFGNMPNGASLPENALFRIASLEKPITAAAIHRLIDDDMLNSFDFAFDLGQTGGGILDYTPFGGTAGDDVDAIFIDDLLNHQGGWRNEDLPLGDPQFSAIEIADEMNVTSPPGRDNTIRYMMAQDTTYTPGTNGCFNSNGSRTFCYSNFGYMVLGRIVEVVSGLDLLSYVRSHILRPDMWVPSTEINYGRTIDRYSREVRYECGGCSCPNVFTAGVTETSCPSGGWEQEVFVGHGNLVTSAAPLLVYMDHYQVNVGGDSGEALNGADPHDSNHFGSLTGTSTAMRQEDDRVNVVVLFNRRSGSSTEYAGDFSGIVLDMLRSGNYTMPTACVDGFWVNFAPFAINAYGGYNSPYPSIISALNATTPGSKIRFKQGGTTDWTGTLNERMRLDSPNGLTRIGVQ